MRLVATTWEWAEKIDQARAEASKKRAEEILAQKNLDKQDYELAQARLSALWCASIRKQKKKEPLHNLYEWLLYVHDEIKIRPLAEHAQTNAEGI